jgi:hypothetical protein
MEAEIKALNDRDVWELVNLPQNRRPIECRWVYDIKTDGRKRGQLVAKGFSQIPGVRVAFVSSCFHSMSLTQVT